MKDKLKKETNIEFKILLRFRSKEEILAFNFLKKYCQTKNIKINQYLVNLILQRAEHISDNQPGLENKLYSVVRRAFYTGTNGQNIFNSKKIMPAIVNTKILDYKLNLILNLIMGNLTEKEVDNFEQKQLIDIKHLEEQDIFKNIRNGLLVEDQKKIEKLIKNSKNLTNNDEKFNELMSFHNEEGIDF